jgi:hypothetical protein
MDWILEHLQVLFAIAIAVVAILQKLKRARPGEEPPGSAQTSSGDADRTRRVQEEIRRRILERRGLAPAAPSPRDVAEAAPGFPESPPMIEEMRPIVVVPRPLESTEVAVDSGRSTEFEHQQRLIEQFRELEASRQASTVTGPGPTAAGVTAPANRLRPDLRNPAGLRRAVVLREVLGPPVGLS